MPSAGDWGLDVEVPLVDGAGAPWTVPTGSVATFTFQRPDGSVPDAVEGVILGGVARYTVEEDFLDQSGMWSYLLTIDWPTGSRTLDRAYFDVEPGA